MLIHPDYIHIGEGRNGPEEYPLKFYSEFPSIRPEYLQGQYYHVLPEELAKVLERELPEYPADDVAPRMIGVISREDQKAMVEEFFELFKTPWEPCREGGRVSMSSLRRIPALPLPPRSWYLSSARKRCPMDDRNGIKIHSRRQTGRYRTGTFGDPDLRVLATFEGPKETVLSTGNGERRASNRSRRPENFPLRIRSVRRSRISVTSRTTGRERTDPHAGDAHFHVAEMDSRRRHPAGRNSAFPLRI